MCVRAGRSQASASSLAAAAGLSQLVLAVGTGVTHLVRVLAHPDRRPVVRVRLLGLKRAMHLGTVAAALRGGRQEGGETEGDRDNGVRVGGRCVRLEVGGEIRGGGEGFDGRGAMMMMMVMMKKGGIKVVKLTKLGKS